MNMNRHWKKSIPSLLIILSFLLVSGNSFSQTSSDTLRKDDEIARLLRLFRANDVSFLTTDTQYQRYMIYSLYSGAEAPMMPKIEEQRIDKQADTPAGTGPTNSTVSKGSVPWLFGFAVEHGAVTQSVDNNVITFRGNIANLAKTINAKNYIESYRRYQDNTIFNLISRASFAVSFVPSQSNSTNNQGQSTLAGYSAHIDLYNHRDPRDSRHIDKWRKLITSFIPVANSAGHLHNLMDMNHREELQEWHNRAVAAFATVSPVSSDDEIKTQIKQVADDYVSTFGHLQDLMPSFQNVEQSIKTYTQQKGDVVDQIENSPIVSLEYTNTRQSVTTTLPQSAGNSTAVAAPLPDLSNINLISSLRFVGRSQLTFNAGATFFNSLPKMSSSGSVRDWRVSGQVDVPLPEIPQIGKSTLSFSGLFVSLLEQPLGQMVLINGVAESRTGNIGLFQAKFTVPVKGSGVKIPISLTASNRTELIKEQDVRGSIGITFDLDSLFSKAGVGGK